MMRGVSFVFVGSLLLPGCAPHEPETPQEPAPEMDPGSPAPSVSVPVDADEPGPCTLLVAVSPRHCDGHAFEHQLHFEANEAYPRDDAETNASIDAMAEALAAVPGEEVVLSVHTSTQGTASYNARISAARARALAEVLDARGVDASRILPVGAGELYPILDNDGCDSSRRVELTSTRPECAPPQAADPGG